MGQKYTVACVENHPFSYRQMIYEHRKIIEDYLTKSIGFRVFLTTGMDVHHINGIKNDNRLENLELITKSNHTSRYNLGHPRYGGREKRQSPRYCLICGGSKTTFVYDKGRKYEQWTKHQGGFVCNTCHTRLYRAKRNQS